MFFSLLLAGAAGLLVAVVVELLCRDKESLSLLLASMEVESFAIEAALELSLALAKFCFPKAEDIAAAAAAARKASIGE